MKCKGKCFDRQSGETQEPFPLRRWREWIRSFTRGKQLGRDPKSMGDFELSSKPNSGCQHLRLDIRKNFPNDQVMKRQDFPSVEIITDEGSQRSQPSVSQGREGAG